MMPATIDQAIDQAPDLQPDQAPAVGFVSSADPASEATRTLRGRQLLGQAPGVLELHGDGSATLTRADLCLVFCPPCSPTRATR